MLISAEPGAQAVRRLLTELMGFADVGRYLAERVAGIGIRYDFGDGPELLGRRLRDVRLSRGRLYELTRDGRGLVVDRAGALSVAGWADRVDYVSERGDEGGDGVSERSDVAELSDLPKLSAEVDAPAVLLRPDGHVAWIGEEQQGLERELRRWFGEG